MNVSFPRIFGTWFAIVCGMVISQFEFWPLWLMGSILLTHAVHYVWDGVTLDTILDRIAFLRNTQPCVFCKVRCPKEELTWAYTKKGFQRVQCKECRKHYVYLQLV